MVSATCRSKSGDLCGNDTSYNLQYQVTFVGDHYSNETEKYCYGEGTLNIPFSNNPGTDLLIYFR